MTLTTQVEVEAPPSTPAVAAAAAVEPVTTTPEVTLPKKRGTIKYIPFSRNTTRAIFTCRRVSSRLDISLITVTKPTKVVVDLGRITLQSFLTDFTKEHCHKCKFFSDGSKIYRQYVENNPECVYKPISEILKEVHRAQQDTYCGGITTLRDIVSREDSSTPESTCMKGVNFVERYKDSGRAVINAPELMWLLKKSFRKGSISVQSESTGSVFAIEGAKVDPYRLANVYPDGKICWGGVRRPTNPRELVAGYWGSTFNSDLMAQWAGNVKSSLENYKQPPCTKDLKAYLYETVIGIKRPVEGLVITNSGNFMKAVPKEKWLKHGDIDYVIAWKLPSTEGVLLECRGLLLSMKNLNARCKVTVVENDPAPTNTAVATTAT